MADDLSLLGREELEAIIGKLRAALDEAKRKADDHRRLREAADERTAAAEKRADFLHEQLQTKCAEAARWVALVKEVERRADDAVLVLKGAPVKFEAT